MKKQTRKSREDVRDLPLKVKAEMALKEAVAEALAEHKRRGNPIAVWRNGKAAVYRRKKSSCRKYDIAYHAHANMKQAN